MIIFAAISPHPPIILPEVGSEEERLKVKDTIDSLKKLGKEVEEKRPDLLIISSPHPNWGFNVPLFYLAKDFQGEIKTYLMGSWEPEIYFQKGKTVYNSMIKDSNKKIGLIASGDLSHRLKEDGPYGFHEQGPKFDQTLIRYLKEKEVDSFLKLNEEFPEAGECGLRSFCFLLGILEAFRKDNPDRNKWEPEILSYNDTFGVGYMVASFKITSQ